MKRILAALLCALSVAAFLRAFVVTDQAQRNAFRQATSGIGLGFTLPANPALADPDALESDLEAATQAANANVLRSSSGFELDGTSQVTHYVLLTRPTALFDRLSLASGRVLAVDDTASGSRQFLSTARTDSPDQVGILSDFAANDRVYVRPLSAAWSALPVAGSYRVEARNPDEAQQFIDVLLKRINDRLGAGERQLTSRDLLTEKQSTGIDGAVNVAGLLGLAQGVLVAMALLLLVYHLLHEAKQVGVLKLHGLSSLLVWWRMAGRLVAGVGLTSVVAGAAVSLVVPGTNLRFTGDVAAALTTAFLAMLISSLLTTAYTVQVRPSDSLKNRKDTTGLFAVNCVVRGVATIGVVAIGASLLTQYQGAMTAATGLGDWASTRQYGIFSPTLVGNDLEDSRTGGTGSLASEVFDLYRALNEQGGLFVDSTAFQPGVTPEGAWPTMVVNPNYLAAYPILAEDGRPVSISESTTDWVVLAPSSLRGRAAELQSYFERKRHGDTTEQGALQAELALFGREAPSAVANQDVRVVWVRDGQQAFSFNPEVATSTANRLNSPLIEVMTLANSLGQDRANMITGGPESAMKVRLVNGDTAVTQQSLQPLLSRLHLDDNLRRVITMEGYVADEVERVHQGLLSILVSGVALAVALLVLIGQTLTIVFERYSRRIVMRRLFGLGFFARYAEYLAVMAALWAAQVIGALVVNAAGVSPFSTDTTASVAPTATVLAVAAVVLGVELVFSTAVLGLIERRNTVAVLKGDF